MTENILDPALNYYVYFGFRNKNVEQNQPFLNFEGYNFDLCRKPHDEELCQHLHVQGTFNMLESKHISVVFEQAYHCVSHFFTFGLHSLDVLAIEEYDKKLQQFA